MRRFVADEAGIALKGPIRLLTNLRYFGHGFNPVSFYYCFDEAGEKVEVIVAEVNNTPWGEQYCYILPDSHNKGSATSKRFLLDKRFHVSPFMDMNIDYDWHFKTPAERLVVHMKNFQQDKLLFDASLSLQQQPVNGVNLAGALTPLPTDDRQDSNRHPLPGTAPVAEESTVLPTPRQTGGTEPGEKTMKPAALCIDKRDAEASKQGIFSAYAKRILLKQLEKLQHGELILNDGSNQYIFGHQDDRLPRAIAVTVHDQSFYSSILINGGLGAGEAYIDGSWTCEDLTGIVELFICNRNYLEGSGLGMRWFAKPLQLLQRLYAAQYPERQSPQYSGALRPWQRPVRIVPRQDHDVFLRNFSS